MIIENLVVSHKIKFNLDNYVKGTDNIVAQAGGGGGVACPCNLCGDLRILAAEAKKAREVIDIEKFELVQAEATKEKLSINVIKPGFYPHAGLSEKTGGKYDMFLFLEAGKYSLNKLYAEISDKVLVDDSEVVKVKMSWLNEKLAKSVSYPMAEKLTENEAWKSIINTLLTGKIEEKKIDVEKAENYEKVFKINDRFIPMFFNSKNDTFFGISGDGLKIEALTGIPGITTKDRNKEKAILVGYKSSLLSKGSLGETGIDYVKVFAYDIVEKEIVFSQDIENFIHDFVKGHENNAMALGLGKMYELTTKMMSPLKMQQKISAEFAAIGFGSITACNVVLNESCNVSYSEFDHKTERGKNVNYNVEGYYVEFMYKKAKLVGNHSDYLGNPIIKGDLWVRYDEKNDKCILIKSPWCQRISSWSKNVLGVVDQHYNIWPIVDWITGPFHENYKNDFDLKEAPIVFMGNKTLAVKQNAVNDFMEKMKQHMM